MMAAESATALRCEREVVDGPQAPHAASMPSDIIFEILLRLMEPRDVLAACTVCQVWRQAEAVHSESLWARFVPGVPPRQAKYAFLHSNRRLEMLERTSGRAKAWIKSGSCSAHQDDSSTGFGFLAGLVQLGPVARFLDTLAPRRFQVLVTGLEAVGKTAVLDTVAGRSLSWAERAPRGRHGVNVERIHHLSGAEVTLIEGDPDDVPALLGSAHDGCTVMDGVIVVLDTLRDIEALRSLLHSLIGSPQLARRPLLLLCNKQDLVDTTPPPSIIFDALRLDLLTDRAWRLQGCCTSRGNLTGQNSVLGLVAGAQWLAAEMKKRHYT